MVDQKDALPSPSAAAARPVDEELWAALCKVFFFQKEHQHKAKAIGDDAGISEHDAIHVVKVVEQVKTSEDCQRELPKMPDATETLLHRIGLVASPSPSAAPAAADHVLWSAPPSVVVHLDKVKSEQRTLFHQESASFRYDDFDAQVQKNLQHQRQALHTSSSGGDEEEDLEGGARQQWIAYQETPQMAYDQRDALADFVRRDEMLCRPFLHGLYQVLTRQAAIPAMPQQQPDSVAYWDLDDAALVERGEDFAFAAVTLLLVHLRFCLVTTEDEQPPVGTSTPPAGSRIRRYIVDPQLSNRRIERLIQLLPSFPKGTPTSGTIDTMRFEGKDDHRWQRTNIVGAQDASCPQDSLFYPILSHCVIL